MTEVYKRTIEFEVSARHGAARNLRDAAVPAWGKPKSEVEAAIDAAVIAQLPKGYRILKRFPMGGVKTGETRALLMLGDTGGDRIGSVQVAYTIPRGG
jgi:hypothetical protein